MKRKRLIAALWLFAMAGYGALTGSVVEGLTGWWQVLWGAASLCSFALFAWSISGVISVPKREDERQPR